MDKQAPYRTVSSRVARFAAAVVIAGAAVAALTTLAAQAANTGTNQDIPGLADTPGNKPSIKTVDRSLVGGSLELEDGMALLDSDVLLKVYYYAYSGQAVDYSAILTENTQHIVPPKPVQPSAAQKQAIDRLMQSAKAHPDVLIKVGDIALDAYDKVDRAYPIDNRLFIKGGAYYFDNSPYHYRYTQPESFRKLHCAEPKTMAVLDSAIANYVHFSMDIIGHVSGAEVKRKALVLVIRKVALKDGAGSVLISQGGS
ncbi:MAG TPA: hypothetical protein VMV33_01560 [Rhodocyclaceae bacterium]|nr:hypothetical protein [Rhodocyclaceae bacterium]